MAYDRLAMSAPTREQFVELVMAQVRSKFPLVKLARAADANFSLRVNGHVTSLENLYRISILNPDDLKRNVDRWIVELIRASEGTPEESGRYEDVKDRVLPMVLGQATADVSSAQMVTQPLLGSLTIAYAIDHDRTISYIPKSVFQSWNMSIDDLHEQAVQNLVTRSEQMAAQAAKDEETDQVNLILFQTMDGYDASRVLLPNLHERLKGYLGSPFLAGIPNRDILICFRDDASIRDRLVAQIAADYKQMPHQVTDKLLLVTPDGLAPWDPPQSTDSDESSDSSSSS